MPGKEGIETIVGVKKSHPDIKIVAISGGGKVGPEKPSGAGRRPRRRRNAEKALQYPRATPEPETC